MQIVLFENTLDTEDPKGRAKDIAIAFNEKLKSATLEIVGHLLLADRKSRERSLAVTKLQEAFMWLSADTEILQDSDE